MLDQNDNLPQADGQLNNDTVQSPTTSNLEEVLLHIDQTNAEELDEETTQTVDIPLKNYDALSFDELNNELDLLLTEFKVIEIKNHVEDLKKAFLNKYNAFIDEKREEYKAENEGSLEGFEYNLATKNKFDNLYNKYKDKRTAHFNTLQDQLKSNLKKREELLSQLKEILDNTNESAPNLIKKVNSIREEWKQAGPIPKDKYNHIFNNFQFHIERFYEHLNMDRELRDLEFKNNYDQKIKIIDKVKDLVKEKDTLKAFRELQTLHKIWKEEIGPVAKEFREELWNEFSTLTKKLHDKREEFFVEIKNKELINLSKRKAIVANIISISNEKINNHNGWQNQISRIETLRDAFINAGRVPAENNDAIWADFKEAVKKFNTNKNAFYKDIKKDQQANLLKKQDLLEKANSLKDSNDFQSTTPIMKKIQEDWKTIGHVPRKFSDSIWKDFKNACNYYFDRLTKHNQDRNSHENDILEAKKQYLENLKDFNLTGDHKIDLAAIKVHIENWKNLGKLSINKRNVDNKFNKVLDALFDQLSLSKRETEIEKFSSKIETIIQNKDTRALNNEAIFVQRKIEEVQNEIFQLENNIQFITNAKNDNPLIKEINKSIEKHKDELETWKDKLNKLRSLDL